MDKQKKQKSAVAFFEKKALLEGEGVDVLEQVGEESLPFVRTFTSSFLMKDRHDEVMWPPGCDYDNYKKNPVFLYQHEWSTLPIGRCVAIKVTDNAISQSILFDQKDTNALEILRKYDEGFLKGVSVGFLYESKNWMRVDVETEKITWVNDKNETIEFVIPDSLQRPFHFCHTWELLELSVATIPANPLSLVEKDFKTLLPETLKDTIKEAYTALHEKELQNLVKVLKNFVAVKNIVPAHNVTSVDVDSEWNETEALSKLMVWASTDGTGDEATIDWAKFAEAFLIFDVENLEQIDSYKMCHHTVNENDQLMLVWKNLKQTLYDVLIDKDLTVDDKTLAYEHLQTHYKDINVEIPVVLQEEYTEEELQSILNQEITKDEEEENTEEENIEDEEKKEDVNSIVLQKIEDCLNLLNNIVALVNENKKETIKSKALLFALSKNNSFKKEKNENKIENIENEILKVVNTLFKK